MASQGISEIDCSKVKKPITCEWTSSSNNDRSNPNGTKVCPLIKPIMVWKDTKPNAPRIFKCTSAPAPNITPKKSDALISQTKDCFMNNFGKDPKKKSWGTSKNKYNKKCKDRWFKFSVREVYKEDVDFDSDSE
jgi:hypothetical protein